MCKMVQAEHEKLDLIQALEIQTMVDMYNRLISACHKKCIQPAYSRDAEIATGEAVCLDRCVSKFLDVYECIGKRLREISQNDEDLLAKK